MMIALRIIFYTDNIVIGAFVSTSAITFYAIGAMLVGQLKAFISSMTNVFSPATSEFGAQNRDDKVQALLIKGTKYSLYLVLPIDPNPVIISPSLYLGPSLSILCLLQ